MADDVLLEVTGLAVEFPAAAGVVRAAQDLDLRVGRGEIVGLVGESGCGKSATALGLIRLVPEPGRVTGGRVQFEGVDLLRLTEKEIRRYRGAGVAYVPQEPGLAFSPVLSIGSQIVDVVRAHRRVGREEAWRQAVEALDRVGIPDAGRRARAYPHQYSGGMKQRALIAMALAARPRVLVADEPTTAIDPTLQAGILQLFRSLVDEGQLGGMLLITHDLGVVAAVCDRVLVMYAGRIVERATVATLFAESGHPYTRGLIGSMPDPDRPRGELPVIPGQVPDLAHLPQGCAFGPRCPHVVDACRTSPPPLLPRGSGHEVACVLRELP